MTVVWGIIILPAHELPLGGEAPELLLQAETDDPEVIASIEASARDHGVILERVE